MNGGKIWAGVLCGAALLVLASCQGSMKRTEPVTVDEIAAHIRYLSDDLLEGRAVGTKGIEMAASYHEDYFRTMGLEPAFGTDYLQTFPLKGSTPDPLATLEIGGPAVALAPVLGDDEDLYMGQSHIFAVQAKDEAGAVTGIFDR
ncbi:MAG: hypothetical protein HGA94_03785, partial [Candidatus Aminicenantes bacterium]|nr:hypothetical protein [Candidatus Aminicenantes bacterium]